MDVENSEIIESSPIHSSSDSITSNPSTFNPSKDSLNHTPTLVSKTKLTPKSKSTPEYNNSSGLNSAATNPAPGSRSTTHPEVDSVEPELNCDKVNLHSNSDHTIQPIPGVDESKPEVLKGKDDGAEDHQIEDEPDEDENSES